MLSALAPLAASRQQQLDIAAAAIQLLGMTWCSSVPDDMQQRLSSGAASLLQELLAVDSHPSTDMSVRLVVQTPQRCASLQPRQRAESLWILCDMSPCCHRTELLDNVLWSETPLSDRGVMEQGRVLAFAASSWLQALRGGQLCTVTEPRSPASAIWCM